MEQRKIAVQKIFLFIFTVLCITIFVPQGTAYAATFTNETILLPSTTTSAFSFGNSSCISGDYAIVGAVSDGPGQAYIYHWNGTSWEEQQLLTASDKTNSDAFGWSVSMSGDYAIVGAQYADPSKYGNAGEAYIYHWNGTSWEEQQILVASDKASNDNFGYSVSISGDYAIVSTLVDKAYIFQRSGTSWTQQQILKASDQTGGAFGNRVSMSGDYAIVGANVASSGGITMAGQAYIYHNSGTSWEEQQILSASDKADRGSFGDSVSISGDDVIVSATGASSGGLSGAGQAYIYHWNGTSWEEQQILSASDKSEEVGFGYSTFISGDYAIVGVTNTTSGAISYAGQAYIYHRNGTSWVENQILGASDATEFDQFGYSVSISDAHAIVGAAFKSPNGEAYLYDLVDSIVTYDANGGSGLMAASSGMTGDVITLKTNTFTKTGSYFTGWSTTSDGAVAYTDGESYTFTSSDVTLYAIWVTPAFNILGSTSNPNLRFVDYTDDGTTYHLIRGLKPLGETINTVMGYFKAVGTTWVLSSYNASTGTYTTVSDTSTDAMGNLFRIDVYNPDATLFGTYYIVIMGDLNCNGVVNNTDSMTLANHAANVSTISGTLLLYSADTDGGGSFNNTDTSSVRNQAAAITEMDQ